MAVNFQASLINPVTGESGVVLNEDCTTITITDHSNYVLSDEDGFEQTDFTVFRQLIITYPNGDTYGFDAQGGLQSPWVVPNVTPAATAALTLPVEANDGAYCATLYTVPTYDNAVDYPHTSTSPTSVWYVDGGVGNLYSTIADPPAATLPSDTDYWKIITIEDLSAKFKVTQCWALTCRELFQCYEKLVHEANCVITEDLCDDDGLCTNKTFLAAVKLRMLLDGISYAAQESDWEAVQVLTNAAKKICSC